MLKQRIEILLNANVISNECAGYVNKVIDLLAEHELEQGKMEMFTTHLAMATERIIKHEDLTCLPDDVWQQIASHNQYKKAEEVYQKISLLAPIKIPNEEMQYLIMHLCNLFS